MLQIFSYVGAVSCKVKDALLYDPQSLLLDCYQDKCKNMPTKQPVWKSSHKLYSEQLKPRSNPNSPKWINYSKFIKLNTIPQ